MKIELTLAEIDAILSAIDTMIYNPSRFVNKNTIKHLDSIKTKLVEYKKEFIRPSVGRKGWRK